MCITTKRVQKQQEDIILHPLCVTASDFSHTYHDNNTTTNNNNNTNTDTNNGRGSVPLVDVCGLLLAKKYLQIQSNDNTTTTGNSNSSTISRGNFAYTPTSTRNMFNLALAVSQVPG